MSLEKLLIFVYLYLFFSLSTHQWIGCKIKYLKANMFIELSSIAHAVLLSTYHNTPNLTTLIPILPASHASRASLCARFHAIVIKRCQSLESCRPSLRVRRHSKWQHLWKGGVRFLVTLLQRAFLTILPSGCSMHFEPSHSLACFST